MTLRSRLSAAWRAFRRDDFPPVRIVDGDIQPPYRWPRSYADECVALKAEQEAEVANIEFVDRGGHYPPSQIPQKPSRIKRRKLASVPKE